MASQIEYWKRIQIDGIDVSYSISTTGKIKNIRTGHVSKGCYNKHRGYMLWHTTRYGKQYVTGMHRLMALTFLPIPNQYAKKGLGYEDLVVNHKDGNKRHNDLYNLEWVTQKRNVEHASETGLLNPVKGEDCHLAKMTEKQAIRCCKLLEKGKSFDEVAKKVGVSRKSVIHIKSGECWKHISCKYTFPKNDRPKPNSHSEGMIHEICRLLDTNEYNHTQIASMVGVSREYVRDIHKGKRQEKIAKNYNFYKKSILTKTKLT